MKFKKFDLGIMAIITLADGTKHGEFGMTIAEASEKIEKYLKGE